MRSKPVRRWRYVPAGDLDGRPHVVVDGAPRPGTVCTLSHWPGTPTPKELWADTSAEIVLRALGPGSRKVPGGVEVATVDHYDADGIIALALLVVEGLAEAHGPLLAAAANTGDFDVVADRSAALVAFALAALGREHGSADRALDQLPAVAARPEAFADLWGAEAAAYDAACAMASAGGLTIEERLDIDLAVVRVDEANDLFRVAGWERAPVHRAAVHSATGCMRVATVVGRRCEVRFRYESWVRFMSRRPRRRVDLAPLAAELTKHESDGGQWLFEGVGAITPALRREDGAESTLEPEEILTKVSEVLEELDQGPGAFDPYAPPGAATLVAAG